MVGEAREHPACFRLTNARPGHVSLELIGRVAGLDRQQMLIVGHEPRIEGGRRADEERRGTGISLLEILGVGAFEVVDRRADELGCGRLLARRDAWVRRPLGEAIDQILNFQGNAVRDPDSREGGADLLRHRIRI